MQNKKSQITLFLLLIIALGIWAVFFFDWQGFLKLSFLDAETQLKQEYTTYWASSSDEQITNEGGQFYQGALFTGYNRIYTDCNPTCINLAGGVTHIAGSQISTTKKFKGEEVVMTTDGGINQYGVCYVTPKSLNPEGSHLDGNQHLFRYVPNTFDNSLYSVYRDGLLVKQNANVGDGFNLGINCDTGSGAVIGYIGYKSEYSCNLREDEVWMQEAFAQPFSVKDLSLPPVKYCDAERPFTLRSLTEGEKKIRFEEGILPLNKGQTIPPRALTIGEFITINYATPNVAGVTNTCGAGEANIKIGGKWICQNIVPKAETVTRIVERREIIPITSGNTWVYSSHIKPSFNIGNKQFSGIVSYSCAITEGETISPPNPSSNCYSAKISYDGKEIILEDKQTAKLEENIDMQFFADGQLTSIKNELSGKYIFNVIGKPVNVNSIGGENLKLNQISYLNADITNNMPDGQVIIKTKQKVQNINLNLPEKEYAYEAKKGNNMIRVPVNTENLGLNSIELQVFYPINADAETLLSSDRIILNVDVSQEKSIIEFVDVKPPEPQIEQQIKISIFQKFRNKIISFFRNLFS